MANQIGFVYDPTIVDENGNPRVLMVVVPDHDGQLDDPSFNPPGAVQIRLSLAEYRANAVYDVPDSTYLQTLIPGYVVPPLPVEDDE